jgi:hypothetical protein
MEKEIILSIFGGVGLYLILLFRSFSYSCGGWDKSCGLCWVGIVQAPLMLFDYLLDKIKTKKEKKT